MLLALLLVATAVIVQAQELVWDIDASAVVNNREGGDKAEAMDQTIPFTRLAAEVGISLDDSTHTLMGGAAWFQPMIENLGGCKVVPTLYYRYSDGPWHLALGWVPRTQLVEPLPTYLWNDSLNYCTPNLRGGVAQVITQRAYAQIFLDWRQLPTQRRREAFNAVLSGYYRLLPHLSVGGYVQYNHLAKSKNDDIEEHVCDDLTLNPMLRYQTTWDNGAWLRIDGGAIIQLQRDRGDGDWLSPAAAVVSAQGQWRWLEVRQTFKAGGDIYPLRKRYGNLFNLGDNYYRDDFYSRTDVIGHLIQTSNVDVTLGMTLHVTDRKTGFWQQLAARFYIDGSGWKGRKSSQKLRQLF